MKVNLFLFWNQLCIQLVLDIEGWLTECGVDLQGKGTEYEQYIKTTLSSVILDNDLLSNSFLIAENEEISVNGVTEEIDLLFKIDNLIVLGEAKCVIVNDSILLAFDRNY